MPSTPRKRLHNDENAGTPARVLNTPRDPFRTPFQPQQPTLFTPTTPVIRTDSFLDGFTPVAKKRRVVRNYTQEEITEMRHAAAERRAHEQAQAKERDAKHEKMQKNSQLNQALQAIREAGFKTLHSFMDTLMSTEDPTRSSQVTQMIDSHGISLLEGIHRRCPEVANDWAISTTRELVIKEGDELARCFRPQPGTSITRILQQFSLKGFLSEAESVAPTIYQVLRQVAFPCSTEGDNALDGDNAVQTTRKNRELVSCLRSSSPMSSPLTLYLRYWQPPSAYLESHATTMPLIFRLRYVCTSWPVARLALSSMF